MFLRTQSTSDTLEIVAIVTNNDDPEKRGRFKIKVNGTEYPFWVTSQLQWGSFVVPEVGQKVVVYSDFSSLNDRFEGESSIFAPNYRWKGETILTTDTYEKKHVVNDEFKTNYTKRTGFFTKAGHVIVFDDKKGAEDIYMINGKTKAKIEMLSDGSISLTDADGNVVSLKDKKISAVHNSGPSVELSANNIDIDAGATGTSVVSGGVKSELASTTEARVSGATVTLAATVSLNITSNATVVLDAPSIKLGDSALSALAKSPELAALLNAHAHFAIDNVTPLTGVPMVPFVASAFSTTKTKGE